MPLSLRSHLFTSYILTIFKQRNLSRKYEKMPNIVIHACKHITETVYFLKYLARKFGFVYLRFDPLRRNS